MIKPHNKNCHVDDDTTFWLMVKLTQYSLTTSALFSMALLVFIVFSDFNVIYSMPILAMLFFIFLYAELQLNRPVERTIFKTRFRFNTDYLIKEQKDQLYINLQKDIAIDTLSGYKKDSETYKEITNFLYKDITPYNLAAVIDYNSKMSDALVIHNKIWKFLKSSRIDE